VSTVCYFDCYVADGLDDQRVKDERGCYGRQRGVAGKCINHDNEERRVKDDQKQRLASYIQGASESYHRGSEGWSCCCHLPREAAAEFVATAMGMGWRTISLTVDPDQFWVRLGR
jgi:hypothetical protein